MQTTLEKGVLWTFTLHNPDKPLDLHPKMQCMVYQKEKAPTTGTIHYQGCFKLLNRNGVKFKTAQKYVPFGTHLVPSRGSWKQNYDYCTKTATRVDGTEPVVLGDLPQDPDAKPSEESALKKLIMLAKVPGTTIRELIEADPETWARNHNSLDKIMNIYGIEPVKSKYSWRDFDTLLIAFEPVKTLIFIGPSGIGKTQFALAHFQNPCFVSHIDDVRTYDPKTHDGIVFDDVEFTHWPLSAQIHLVDSDQPRSLHARFSNVKIPANTRKIFTCNEGRMPVNVMDEAISRRVHVVQWSKYGPNAIRFKATSPSITL